MRENEKTETLRIYIWDVPALEVARKITKYMEAEANKPGFDPQQYKVRLVEGGVHMKIVRTYNYPL